MNLPPESGNDNEHKLSVQTSRQAFQASCGFARMALPGRDQISASFSSFRSENSSS